MKVSSIVLFSSVILLPVFSCNVLNNEEEKLEEEVPSRIIGSGREPISTTDTKELDEIRRSEQPSTKGEAKSLQYKPGVNIKPNEQSKNFMSRQNASDLKNSPTSLSAPKSNDYSNKLPHEANGEVNEDTKLPKITSNSSSDKKDQKGNRLPINTTSALNDKSQVNRPEANDGFLNSNDDEKNDPKSTFQTSKIQLPSKGENDLSHRASTNKEAKMDEDVTKESLPQMKSNDRKSGNEYGQSTNAGNESQNKTNNGVSENNESKEPPQTSNTNNGKSDLKNFSEKNVIKKPNSDLKKQLQQILKKFTRKKHKLNQSENDQKGDATTHNSDNEEKNVKPKGNDSSDAPSTNTLQPLQEDKIYKIDKNSASNADNAVPEENSQNSDKDIQEENLPKLNGTSDKNPEDILSKEEKDIANEENEDKNGTVKNADNAVPKVNSHNSDEDIQEENLLKINGTSNKNPENILSKEEKDTANEENNDKNGTVNADNAVPKVNSQNSDKDIQEENLPKINGTSDKHPEDILPKKEKDIANEENNDKNGTPNADNAVPEENFQNNDKDNQEENLLGINGTSEKNPEDILPKEEKDIADKENGDKNGTPNDNTVPEGNSHNSDKDIQVENLPKINGTSDKHPEDILSKAEKDIANEENNPETQTGNSAEKDKNNDQKFSNLQSLNKFNNVGRKENETNRDAIDKKLDAKNIDRKTPGDSPTLDEGTNESFQPKTDIGPESIISPRKDDEESQMADDRNANSANSDRNVRDIDNEPQKGEEIKSRENEQNEDDNLEMLNTSTESGDKYNNIDKREDETSKDPTNKKLDINNGSSENSSNITTLNKGTNGKLQPKTKIDREPKISPSKNGDYKYEPDKKLKTIDDNNTNDDRDIQDINKKLQENKETKPKIYNQKNEDDYQETPNISTKNNNKFFDNGNNDPGKKKDSQKVDQEKRNKKLELENSNIKDKHLENDSPFSNDVKGKNEAGRALKEPSPQAKIYNRDIGAEQPIQIRNPSNEILQNGTRNVIPEQKRNPPPLDRRSSKQRGKFDIDEGKNPEMSSLDTNKKKNNETTKLNATKPKSNKDKLEGTSSESSKDVGSETIPDISETDDDMISEESLERDISSKSPETISHFTKKRNSSTKQQIKESPLVYKSLFVSYFSPALHRLLSNQIQIATTKPFPKHMNNLQQEKSNYTKSPEPDSEMNDSTSSSVENDSTEDDSFQEDSKHSPNNCGENLQKDHISEHLIPTSLPSIMQSRSNNSMPKGDLPSTNIEVMPEEMNKTNLPTKEVNDDDGDPQNVTKNETNRNNTPLSEIHKQHKKDSSSGIIPEMQEETNKNNLSMEEKPDDSTESSKEIDGESSLSEKIPLNFTKNKPKENELLSNLRDKSIPSAHDPHQQNPVQFPLKQKNRQQPQLLHGSNIESAANNLLPKEIHTNLNDKNKFPNESLKEDNRLSHREDPKPQRQLSENEPSGSKLVPRAKPTILNRLQGKDEPEKSNPPPLNIGTENPEAIRNNSFEHGLPKDNFSKISPPNLREMPQPTDVETPMETRDKEPQNIDSHEENPTPKNDSSQNETTEDEDEDESETSSSEGGNEFPATTRNNPVKLDPSQGMSMNPFPSYFPPLFSPFMQSFNQRPMPTQTNQDTQNIPSTKVDNPPTPKSSNAEDSEEDDVNEEDDITEEEPSSEVPNLENRDNGNQIMDENPKTLNPMPKQRDNFEQQPPPPPPPKLSNESPPPVYKSMFVSFLSPTASKQQPLVRSSYFSTGGDNPFWSAMQQIVGIGVKNAGALLEGAGKVSEAGFDATKDVFDMVKKVPVVRDVISPVKKFTENGLDVADQTITGSLLSIGSYINDQGQVTRQRSLGRDHYRYRYPNSDESNNSAAEKQSATNPVWSFGKYATNGPMLNRQQRSLNPQIPYSRYRYSRNWK